MDQPEERPTVSDQMVDVMTDWGIDTVFGMVGHSNLGFAEALRRLDAMADAVGGGGGHSHASTSDLDEQLLQGSEYGRHSRASSDMEMLQGLQYLRLLSQAEAPDYH